MTIRRFAAASAVSFLVACALAAVTIAARAAAPTSAQANPCLDVKNCRVTAGPWVAVPAKGETTFLLECPKRSGTIGGTDALATSPDVRVTWEGNPGSPVRPGTTTSYFAFFHASSAHGKPGLFQPYIGCIPLQKVNARSTVSARITHPGLFLDRWQRLYSLTPGASQTASEGCGKGERLVSGWYAVVFGALSPPDPILGTKVHASVTNAGEKVVASIQTDLGIPAAAGVELQVGAVCAK